LVVLDHVGLAALGASRLEHVGEMVP
jgi:hypothetical protein